MMRSVCFAFSSSTSERNLHWQQADCAAPFQAQQETLPHVSTRCLGVDAFAKCCREGTLLKTDTRSQNTNLGGLVLLGSGDGLHRAEILLDGREGR